MSGRSVLAIVTAIVIATVVLPPAAAFAVNRRRISRATREVAALASRLRGVDSVPADMTLCGPGRPPEAARGAEGWLVGSCSSLASVLHDDHTPPDPWGNGYVAKGGWVLSAGPNGTIDTPFGGGEHADDIVR